MAHRLLIAYHVEVTPSSSQTRCWRCGAVNPAGSRFCSDCGAEVKPRTDSVEPDDPTLSLAHGTPQVPLRYRVTGELGRGGMGVVYRAEDLQLGRPIALKLLRAELLDDPQARSRFLREARAVAAVDHPNLCTVHEVGTTADGAPYIAMAFYDGGPLSRRIAEGPLPVEEAVEIAAQIARGLQRAHEEGVVHRDLKPDNVLLTRRGEIRIVDFGLARLAGSETLTRRGALLGTAAYLSPEQARGERVDHRADLWALGVVLYEMLAGRRPFEGEGLAAVVHEITTAEPRSLGSLRPDLPPPLERIVRKALSRDPADRYREAGAMLADLEALENLTGGGEAPPERSIAVLPFTNLSTDPEQEYFCDGMTEEIINALTQVRGLRVIARTSCFAFKGQADDVREIGRRLDVATLLEGSVRRSGERIRVSVQLVDTKTGAQLWAERYDRRLADVFEVQDEVALSLVERLRLTLADEPDEVLGRRRQPDLEAYELYLQGLHEWNRLTPAGFARSAELYRRSTEADPDFASPVIGLAIWHNSQCFWGQTPPAASFGRAEELARRALELEPRASMAHNVLGNCEAFYRWRWAAGEEAFERALELGPGQAMNHANYGSFLLLRERFDEAIRESCQARDLDPLSSVVQAFTGMNRAWAGDAEGALADLDAALADEPSAWLLHHARATVHLVRGDFDRAMASADQAVDLSGGTAPALSNASLVAYLGGRTERGGELRDRLEVLSRSVYVPPTFFAWLELVQGRSDEALVWMEKAFDLRDPWLLFHQVAASKMTRSEAVDALVMRALLGQADAEG